MLCIPGSSLPSLSSWSIPCSSATSETTCHVPDAPPSLLPTTHRTHLIPAWPPAALRSKPHAHHAGPPEEPHSFSKIPELLGAAKPTQGPAARV